MIDRPDSLWTELFRAIRMWGSEGRIDQLPSRVAGDALRLAAFEHCALFMLDSGGLTLRASAGAGASGQAGGAAPDLSRRIAQRVADSGRTIVAHEPDESGSFRQICCVPLIANRGILGALYLDTNKAERAFTNQDQEFLEMIALQAAMALEHAMLYHSAITDPLTGLFSHRHFQAEVEQNIRRAARTEQPLSLILLDLDHFKELNDRCGHAAGNECLLSVSELLRVTLRTSDILARFGGDEFEVLLPDTTGDAALQVAEKIRAKILELPAHDGIQISGTFGVAGFPKNSTDGADLFLRADESLYEAKEAGRNRCVLTRHASGSASTLAAAPPPGSGHAPRLSPRLPQRRVGDKPVQPAIPAGNVAEQIDGHPLIRRLGMGSNGEVLLVRQPDLDRDVALKRPLTPHLTPEQAAGFEQEARVTASLNHPGVVPVYTTGRDVDGRRYYTMRPLEGFSLAHILDGRKRGEPGFTSQYTMRKLLDVLQRASETLAYAHRRGIAHLDLSPSNIVVGSFGEVTIIDWGMGAAYSKKKEHAPAVPDIEAGRQFTYLIGSPAYMAPEHIPSLGKTPGPEADVFSLGAMLYEILTGQAPYVRGTARETLEAIVSGQLTPPDVLKPAAGIDPMLTELALQALQPAPGQRPTALDFSARLGRYVRRESDWETIRFGAGGQALREDDWEPFSNNWQLEGGAWVAQGGRPDHTLAWKVPVRGSFNFTCEAWCGAPLQELSMFSRSSIARGPSRLTSGYIFHAGADSNVYSKFSRCGVTTMTRRGAVLEPGRHHLLRLEFRESDGCVEFSVDGRVLFNYRELFMFSGDTVGFYTWGDGPAFFRPLEIQIEKWTLEVPVIRLADGLFNQQAYEPAHARYAELAERMPSRMEGLEARLKEAICLAKMGRLPDAERVLNSLSGTAMAPFALIEHARICMKRCAPGDGERAADLCARVMRDFPESPARSAVNEMAQELWSNDLVLDWNYARDMSVRERLLRLGSHTCDPPGNTQLACHAYQLRLLLKQGKWKEALRETLEFEGRPMPGQFPIEGSQVMKYAVAVANGRDDLLPRDPETVMYWMPEAEWTTNMLVHAAVRTSSLARILESYSPDPPSGGRAANRAHAVLQALLASNDCKRAIEWLKQAWRPDANARFVQIYHAGAALLEAQLEEEFQAMMKSGECLADITSRHVVTILRARHALERRDFEGAAGLLTGVSQPQNRFFICDALLHQTFLSSLGMLKSPSHDELLTAAPRYMAGTELELAEIFLGLKPPVPGPDWPHPAFRPEWRLWLALWLEERGDKKAAYAVALPSRDARYGLTNSQPAIAALLERCKAGDT